MAVGTYQQYLEYGGKASQEAYNANVLKTTGKLPPGATGGSGSVMTGGGGFTPGVAYSGNGSPKYSSGQALAGGAAAGTAAGAGFIAGGGLGATGALAAAGPAGWAVGAGLLAYSALKGKKSNKEFEGTRDTGGSEAWKQRGGTLASPDGDIPSLEQFTSQGRWLNPQDAYSHDYGRAFTGKDAQYYENFKKTAEGYKASGDMNRYKATLAAHGFEAKSSGGAPAKSSGGGRRKAPAFKAPAPKKKLSKQAARDEVTPPAKGLENTIKTQPKLLRERRRRSYLTS